MIRYCSLVGCLFMFRANGHLLEETDDVYPIKFDP
jgi:hypothetical protein